MGRKGRPRKEWTAIDKEKMALTDDIINSIRYNAKLNSEQIEMIKSELDKTFNAYSMEKLPETVEEVGLVRDINNKALQDFLSSKKAESKSKTTIYNYGNELGKLFVILNKDYRDITAQDIRQYMEYRKDHDKVRPITLQNIRMYLMSFYKWAVIEERVYKNPMDKIGTIKAEKRVIETLTDEEVEIIRCACDSERDLAIVDLLSSSGMRVSELCGLNKNDVNFETGEVKVYGKGSKERICFITGRCKVHLRWYLQTRVDTNPALFVNSKKPYNRITKGGVEFILKRLGEKSGLDVKTRIYPHKFRSTLATNMINKGASADQVKNVLGHANVDTTLQCYARVDTSTVKQAHHTYVA